jgi:hypothetical protein
MSFYLLVWAKYYLSDRVPYHRDFWNLKKFWITLSLWIILEESARRMHPLRGPLEASSVSTTWKHEKNNVSNGKHKICLK